MMTITPKIRLKDALFYKKVLPWITASAGFLILLGTILLIIGSGFNAGLQAAINATNKEAQQAPSIGKAVAILVSSNTTAPSVADHVRVSMLNSFGSTFTAIGAFALFVCLYFYVTCYLYRYEAYAEYDAELYDKLAESSDLDVAGSMNLTSLKKKLYGSQSDDNKSFNPTTPAPEQSTSTTTVQSPDLASPQPVKKYSISQCLDSKIKEELGFSISESHKDMTATWFASKVNNAARYQCLLTKIGIQPSENLVVVRAYPYENTVWLTIVDFNQPENNQIIQLTDFQNLKDPLEHQHSLHEMVQHEVEKIETKHALHQSNKKSTTTNQNKAKPE